MNKAFVVVLLSAFATIPAVAADLYGGAKLGIVNYGYNNVSNNGQIAFGLLGGIYIMQNLAVEAEYSSLGGFDSSTGTITGSVFDISAIGFLPLDRQISLFGKLGISSTSLQDKAKPGYFGDFTRSNTGLMLGFGGQFVIKPTADLRVGFDIYPVGDATSSTSTAGMLYASGVFKF